MLRGFGSKRVIDLHSLAIGFAVSMILETLVFLVDLKLDRLKLL